MADAGLIGGLLQGITRGVGQGLQINKAREDAEIAKQDADIRKKLADLQLRKLEKELSNPTFAETVQSLRGGQQQEQLQPQVQKEQGLIDFLADPSSLESVESGNVLSTSPSLPIETGQPVGDPNLLQSVDVGNANQLTPRQPGFASNQSGGIQLGSLQIPQQALDAASLTQDANTLIPDFKLIQFDTPNGRVTGLRDQFGNLKVINQAPVKRGSTISSVDAEGNVNLIDPGRFRGQPQELLGQAPVRGQLINTESEGGPVQELINPNLPGRSSGARGDNQQFSIQRKAVPATDRKELIDLRNLLSLSRSVQKDIQNNPEAFGVIASKIRLPLQRLLKDDTIDGKGIAGKIADFFIDDPEVFKLKISDQSGAISRMQDLFNKVAKLQSGAVLNREELKRLGAVLPNIFEGESAQRGKVDSFIDRLSNILSFHVETLDENLFRVNEFEDLLLDRSASGFNVLDERGERKTLKGLRLLDPSEVEEFLNQ